MTPTIRELWRYPVKSLQGERLDDVVVGDLIPGDRRWGVVDVETRKLLSAKTVPDLLQGAARVEGEACRIELPGGTTGSDDDAVDERLSAWLGRPVRLATTRAGETATISIEWDEGQDDPGELPVFDFETQPGWFFDSGSSLHLIGTATLEHLEREVGPGAGDVRRFRPNLVAFTTRPFEEDDWVDAVLGIGAATAWVKKRTERCVVITRAFGEHPPSRDTLRHLARTHGRDAGISLQPRMSGRIAVGDAVTLTS